MNNITMNTLKSDLKMNTKSDLEMNNVKSGV